ncbi:ACP S-malonyltransferase [Actinomadura sp. SCN-SB]|uniref:ACP S-malonyltransferase n=1 Tax=Actinomadura sp. SCN-SB TaxID=3373092 RepID=UPI0037527C58
MSLSSAWREHAGSGAAFLFPGTGSSGVPDLRALAGAHPSAPALVEEVADAVEEALHHTVAGPGGEDAPRWPSMRRVLLEEPEEFRTVADVPGVPQMASYTVSVAVERVLRAAGVEPGFAVGQSFGELPAMVCAGVFTVGEGAVMAASLVRVLARYGAGGGMGLVAADEGGAAELIAAAGAAGRVVVACRNAPSVTVVSGPSGPLERVLEAGRRAGVRAVRLAVPNLSHHPAMAGADREWYGLIRRFPQRPLRVAVHSPVRGRAYRDGDDLHRALAECIVRPVSLPETLRAVHAAGASVFAEAGAGDALCQCARLCVPGARTLVPLPPRPRRAAAAGGRPAGA